MQYHQNVKSLNLYAMLLAAHVYGHKLKFVIIMLLSFCSLSSYTQENPFEELHYDRVVAFEFNGEGLRKIDKVLREDRQRLDQQKRLDPKQVQRFEEIISRKDAYGKFTAACFDPHFAVIYYLGDSIVGQIDVCLSCNYLISSIQIPAVNQTMIDEGTEYERPMKGFSKSTRKELDNFISNLSFNKYRRPLESMFDE